MKAGSLLLASSSLGIVFVDARAAGTNIFLAAPDTGDFSAAELKNHAALEKLFLEDTTSARLYEASPKQRVDWLEEKFNTVLLPIFNSLPMGPKGKGYDMVKWKSVEVNESKMRWSCKLQPYERDITHLKNALGKEGGPEELRSFLDVRGQSYLGKQFDSSKLDLSTWQAASRTLARNFYYLARTPDKRADYGLNKVLDVVSTATYEDVWDSDSSALIVQFDHDIRQMETGRETTS